MKTLNPLFFCHAQFNQCINQWVSCSYLADADAEEQESRYLSPYSNEKERI